MQQPRYLFLRSRLADQLRDRSRSGVQGCNSLPDREFHQAGDVADLELAHDAAAMRFDRLRRQPKNSRRGGARTAFGGEAQHVTLTLGETTERVVFAACGSNVANHQIGHRLAHVTLALADAAQGLDDFGGAGLLDYVAVGPGTKRLIDKLRAGMRRKEQHTCLGHYLAELPRERDAVHPR